MNLHTKTRFAILTTGLLAVLSLLVTAYAYTNETPLYNITHQDIPLEFVCGTTIDTQEEMQAALIRKNMYALNQEIGITPYMGIDAPHQMPSTGQVKVLVLPIMFADSVPLTDSWNQDYEYYQKIFNERDNNGTMLEQSVQSFFLRQSYGRLSVSGDVLPIFFAKGAKAEYYDVNASKYYIPLMKEALATYDIDYSQYDADGDGYVDCLCVIEGGGYVNDYYGAFTSAAGWQVSVESSDIIDYESMRVGQLVNGFCHGPRSSDSNTFCHELGHAMGLMDNYLSPEYSCWLPPIHNEFMGHGNAYVNIFSKYLLGWVDPIIVTDESPIQAIELYAVEGRSTSFDQEAKAILYVPDKSSLPFTEFFIAEYRNAKDFSPVNSDYAKPGITLWHCNAAVADNGFFIDQTNYLQSVRPTGGETSADFSVADLFVPAGSPWDTYSNSTIISPTTIPTNSSFADGTPTKFYMEVVSQDEDRSVVRVGSVESALLGQSALEIIPAEDKMYGDPSFQLEIAGGDGEGAVAWEVLYGDSISVSSDGWVTVQTPGISRVKVTKAGDKNYPFPISASQIIEIKQADINVCTTKDAELVYLYTGEQHKPTPVFIDKRSGAVLTSKDYILSYGENTSPGMGEIILSGTRYYTGTKKIPFIIGAVETIDSPEMLIRLSEKVNEGDVAYTNGFFTLSTDIDLSNQKSWVPIGTSPQTFSGTFDGDGHTIKYCINEGNYQGLFGNTSSRATIQNLNVSGTVSGGVYVGGLVARNHGVIKQCYNSCSVSGSIYAGGITGNNFGIIENCYNVGTISALDRVGGIAGYSNENSKIESCYNIASISGEKDLIGGIVSQNAGSTVNCFYLAGLLNEALGNGDGDKRTSEEFQTESTFLGWDFSNVWTMNAALGRPILQAVLEIKETHTHIFSAKWNGDSESHWHECECGEKDGLAAHKPEPIPGQEATCIRPGKTEGSRCSICGWVLVAQADIPIKSHSYFEEWQSDGANHWQECVICHGRGNIEPHTVDIDPAEAATCTTPGKTEGRHCSVCEKILQPQTTVQPTGHSPAAAWSSDPAGHWHECTVCHVETNRAIHTENDGVVTKPATEEEEGLKTFSCSVCDYEMRTEVLDKLRPSHTHEYSAEWKSNGNDHWHECGCGAKADQASHIEESIPGISPTCTQEGKSEGSRCLVCERILIAQVELPKANHEISDKWHYGVIYEGVFGHWHECINCKAMFTPALHLEDSGTITKEPSAEEEGIKTYSCSVCGYVMRTESIPRLEPPHIHSYPAEWRSDATKHWRECECGEKAEQATHNWGAGVVTTAPSSSKAGVRTYTCIVCKRTRTETIPATGGGSSGGGGGGGGTVEVPTAYKVMLPDKTVGGIVKAEPLKAVKGTTVTLTAKAEEGYALEEIRATDKRGKEIVLKEKADKYTFSMPASDVEIIAQFQKLPEKELPPPAEETPDLPIILPFTDVPEKAWYYDAVTEVYGAGIMTGTSKLKFAPEIPASRGMVVTMLYRMENEPAVTGTSDFIDVPSKRYYAAAVTWATEAGLINGYGDGSFRPDEGITREQLVTVLYRYAARKGYDITPQADLSDFLDAKQVSSYAQDSMAWAKTIGLINGTGKGKIDPTGVATRGQTATIFARFYKVVIQNK